MNAQLIVPAAGQGQRLGEGIPKALVQVGGEPILCLTLSRFDSLGLLDSAVIVITPGRRAAFRAALDNAFPGRDFHLVDGGDERRQSVWNGLEALGPSTEVVVIHDAARPFVSRECIRESISSAQKHGAATVAIPCVDTILQAGDSGFLESTPDRSGLWACQTPQAFQVDVVRAAHVKAAQGNWTATDDATLVHIAGGDVKLVQGARENIKITTPGDIAYVNFLIEHGERFQLNPAAAERS
ncbi:MAG: 2-C-methyl-D-erythritol 4-phosphate cytidylyltransferase [Candidatus Hydrogenedentes bacterium]|jgi:2-C-methyl-D-erythritol 4-phosphate cytidylyltransferase|nr:2-C-methyl-D-erythritol 4-phosphate cytidylyltransferase [Candidatus Hydrogenedentota bacterium]